GENAELLGQLLDRDALGEKHRPRRAGLLELQELAGVLRAGFLGRATQGRLGYGLGGRGGLVRLRRLLDQRRRDVGVGVWLIGPDELPQVNLVGDGDLRLRAALLGRLLGFFLVVLLALDGPALQGRRRRDARPGRTARAPHGAAGPSRHAGPGRSAHRPGARSTGSGTIDGRARGAGTDESGRASGSARAERRRSASGARSHVAAGPSLGVRRRTRRNRW